MPMTRRRLVYIGLLAMLVLAAVAVVRWQSAIDDSRARRPPGSPPIGYENRLKYERGHISNFSGFDNIPVDLWFGNHEGQFDTTRFRIASDYFSKIPLYHGEYASLHVVWPSLRSIDEENEFRRKNAQPPVKGRETFVMTFKENDKNFSLTDKGGTTPIFPCDRLVRDEVRGVTYCNEHRSQGKPGERWTIYWPLDESVRTPYFNNPPRFKCYRIDRPDAHYDRCYFDFAYNLDVSAHIDAHEALTIELVTHFPTLIQFIRSLEIKP